MAKIDALLLKMAESGASDLHLSATLPPTIRRNGAMMKIAGQQPLGAEAIRDYVFEIMPRANRQQYEECRDTDFAYAVEGTRFRVNVFEDRSGICAAMRVIPEKILTAEDLGLPRAVIDFCHLSKGLVVVTGPTGCGKSTTLAAMIDHINRVRSDHIITIEDPIEYVHKSQRCLVNQRQVGVNTRSWKSALRAALREDPNVIMVGEMRDLETVSIALEIAETGHLVFGTLHTATAASTVDRIIDQFPATEQERIRTMLSLSLRGVVAQALLRRADQAGRVAAFEVLVVTAGVANMIREGKTHAIASAIQTGGKFGMVSMNDALAALVAKGTVAPEEAYLKAADKHDLENRLAAIGVRVNVSAIARAERDDEGAAAAPPRPEGAPASVSSARLAKRKPVLDDFESFRATRESGRFGT
jgi:twitching motility protein PilT